MPLPCLPKAGRLRFPRPGVFSVLEACRPGNGTWSCGATGLSRPREWSQEKAFCDNVEREFKFEQTAQDLNPFVVAGRYREARQELAGSQQVLIWSRAEVNSQDLQRAGESFSKLWQHMTHCSDRAVNPNLRFGSLSVPPRQVAFCNVARFIPRFFMARKRNAPQK